MLSTRIRTFIRQQWAGLIALFLVLTGGSAYALSGSNTVFSDDIVNSEVRNADVGPNAVGTGKVVNNNLRSEDVANDSTPYALTGADVANGTLGGADISEAALDVPAARVTRSVGQNVPSGQTVTLAFDQERFDTAGLHSTTTSNSRLTAPRAGVYAIDANVGWAVDPDGVRQVSIVKNGSTTIAHVIDEPESAGLMTQSVSTIAALGAGDFVQVKVFPGGETLQVTKANQTSPEFAMAWLGPPS